MRTNRIIVAALLILVIFAGCKKDILDKTNLNAIDPALVWSDPKLATAYVNKLCLDNLPNWDLNGEAAGMSDESPGGGAYMRGELTENSVDYWPYNQIRNMNILLQDIDQGSLDQTTKDRLKGQTLVLRALRYFELVRRYGGIPLILVPQKTTDDLMVHRNKTSEVFAQVVKDLDDAAKLLPARWTGADEGRITAAAALALKGRVLLFYASPQFNPSNDAQRWTTAYQANKDAKTYLLENNYGLFENFATLWFTEMNKEVILVRRFNENASTNYWEAGTRPLSESQNYTGWNQPTLEMVQAFPMKDGLPISSSSSYDQTRYWLNRDPRFAATIVYNGVLWELSGKAGRKQWTYAGVDPRDQSGTGFFCRKAINVSHTPALAERSTTAWIEIRFAEVLLNLAECAAESGKSDEAYTELKALRQRAGIVPGASSMYGLSVGLTGANLVNAIMEERRVELAFEAKRYWDLRRRKLFDAKLNGTERHRIYSALKVPAAEFEPIKNTVNIDLSYGNYFTDTPGSVDTDKKITYNSNYYFYAIPDKYRQQNKNLEQTTGWTGGTFDPLQ